MSAKKRSRKSEKARAKPGRAAKKVTARKKAIVAKKAAKAHRASKPKPEGARSVSPVKTPVRGKREPAGRQEAPPVEVVEVVRAEVLVLPPQE